VSVHRPGVTCAEPEPFRRYTFVLPAKLTRVFKANAGFWGGIFCLFLLLALGLYLPAVSGGWFFDDYQNIVLNNSVKNLSVSLQSVFSPRGISFLSFAADYSIWGLNASSFRIVNILIHFFNALLVVAFCRELIGEKRTGLAVFIGMIFLCHLSN
jgi:hypothetical protein